MQQKVNQPLVCFHLTNAIRAFARNSLVSSKRNIFRIHGVSTGACDERPFSRVAVCEAHGFLHLHPFSRQETFASVEPPQGRPLVDCPLRRATHGKTPQGQVCRSLFGQADQADGGNRPGHPPGMAEAFAALEEPASQAHERLGVALFEKEERGSRLVVSRSSRWIEARCRASFCVGGRATVSPAAPAVRSALRSPAPHWAD